MTAQTAEVPATIDCDVLVVGSGASGLATAVTAAWHGLRVIVAEKEVHFGGTTAWSGGWMWVPRSPLAIRAGIHEPAEAPRRYLQHELGNQFDAARIDAFLANAPHMVAFFERHTALQFVDGNDVPDFHGYSPDAATGGRSVCAAPFDGHELGALIDRLRPPLAETAPFGMGIASGADLRHFFNVFRSARSTLHVTRRFARHLADLLRFGRGMHLVNGNALVARLLKSAIDLRVELRHSAPVTRLIRDGLAVRGAELATAQGPVVVTARRGVVMAAGGFPHDIARKRALFPHAPSGLEHWSAAPAGNTGDGLRLAEAAGGTIDAELAEAGAWAPVSLALRTDGSVAHFPHLVERAKPGLIAVTAQGKRFVNEADSYHDFMRALFRTAPAGVEVAAWLICDHRFQRRYGLGVARPFPFPLGPALRSGYLKRGTTLAALADACGIDPEGLAATVTTYNRDARDGRDPVFRRGETPYNRAQGDAAHRPNPCVAPITGGPFYAVKVVPGSLGTFAGIATDQFARALGHDEQPIPGLYAVGNDMASIMGGHYPSGGITLGPGMTFAYIAARHLSGSLAHEVALDVA